LITKGDIIIQNARKEDLEAFLKKVKEAGGGYEVNNWGIRFYYKGPLKAVDIETQIHPGFMTDWQPLWAVLMAVTDGETIIHETVMQNRFQYMKTLEQMGAKFELFNPPVGNPEILYNFNWVDCKETDFHGLRIFGPTQFTGGEFTVQNLRAGATTLLAAISGQGRTILHNVEQIDRGYENLDGKLVQMGAKIERS
jgi:UDP-N-acetylglucosamine 1-carboxyvinyltransferase